MELEREEAILRFDQLGKDRTPFFFLVDFEGKKSIIVKKDKASDILFSINGHSNHQEEISPLIPEFSFQKVREKKSVFAEKFDRVVSEIKFGNSFLVNLTIKTPVACSLTLQEIFQISTAKYKAFVPGRFTFFSPETFISIRDNMIYSHPMKGTIDAALPDATQTILNDPKETAEHITIVDLIRNDLSMVSKEVEVTRFRYIDEIKTHEKRLLQVSSEIRGRLLADWQDRLGGILFSLLPAGSISGAPKEKTVEIIQATEDYDRGWYTGICGYFDGEKLDTGVMIRFIEQENGRMFFKSGGGITSFSNLESEYQEMIDKIYVPIR